MRIGEILVREGQLSRQQLAQALRVQELLGQRLGTTLLEEGLVAEDTLLNALGRQRSTQTVSRSELAEVPPEVVRMIPARLAERYAVVPFHLAGRTLSVASADASDLLKEDEIGFLTSCSVKTCIGLEFRIHEALERYYLIASPERHQALARRFRVPLESASRPDATAGTGVPQPAMPPPEAPATVRPPPVAVIPRPPKRAQPRFIELDEEDAALLGSSSSDAVEWDSEPESSALLKPAPLPWLAREAARTEASTAVSAVAAAEPVVAVKAEPPSRRELSDEVPDGQPGGEVGLEEQLSRAAARLRDVEIRDDIGDALLEFCRPHFRRRMVLVTRKHQIIGWRGEGEGVEPAKVRAIEISAQDPSVFLGLTGAGSFWLGSLPALDANRPLVDGLGGAFPKECVVLPVILRSRVVCYVYGDNLEAGVAGAPIAELRRLAAKAGLAFEVYILKNKLRML